MDELSSRLLMIPASKWHVHEAVIARKLRLDREGTNLSELVSYLKKGGKGSKRRGSWEASSHTIDLCADNEALIKFAPYGADGIRYFAIGVHRDRPTMNNQVKLLRGIVGEGLDDSETKERRRLGWLPWATRIDCPEATAFEEIDLPAISFAFEGWLEDDGHLESVGQDVRALLRAMNCVEDDTIDPMPAASNDADEYTDDEDEATKENAPSPEQQPRIRRRLYNMTTRTITPPPPQRTTTAQSPFALGSLRMLDLDELASSELALRSIEASTSSTERVEALTAAFAARGRPLSTSLTTAIVSLSSWELGAHKITMATARQEVLSQQQFRPRKGDLLIDWIEDARRYCNGTRLVSANNRDHTVLQLNANGQRVLTDPMAHCLRAIQFEYNIPMSRLPGLWNAFAVLLLGRPLALDEFSSVATIRTWYQRLHLIDLYNHRLSFEAQTTTTDNEYGNAKCFYTLDDDAKAGFKKYHGVCVSMCDHEGRPAWYQVTAGFAVSSSSDGNSDYNVACLTETFTLKSLAQLGGGVSDNASDATNTIAKTFAKVLELLPDDQGFVNGVRRRPVVFTDPYHNDNLAVSHASKAAFGETDRGNFNLVHHRQFLQFLYDIVNHDKALAQSIMNELTEAAGIPSIRLKVVRERQQRWLVNQVSARRYLQWIRTTVDGYYPRTVGLDLIGSNERKVGTRTSPTRCAYGCNAYDT